MKTRELLAGVVILVLILGSAGSPSAGFSKISPALQAAVESRGAEQPLAVWIYFTDKGPDIPGRLARMEKTFPLRVIKRRLRQGDSRRLADFHDLPVRERYVARLEPFVQRIRHRSRWLNAVSAEVRGSRLEDLSGLPFISRLDTVKTTVFRGPEIPKGGQIPAPSRESQGHALDYGPSFNQVEQINVPALHDMGLSGRDVMICMLDTGFNNLGHRAFSHLDLRASWDFVNADGVVDDEEDQMGVGHHGSNTLAVIGGFFPGEIIGPAYGAAFILGKTENTDWERHIEEDHWVAGAEWADLMGADIISSSLGYRYDFTHGELDYSEEEMDGRTAITTIGANIAASKGVLIVNSAGNEGRESSQSNTIIAPSDSPDVLAAGAVDALGIRTEFSSYGPTSDGRIKPDIMAQGLLVYTVDTGTLTDYTTVAGTSFSCPLSAGTAALILEAHPAWSNRDIMAALKNTASKASDPDNLMGWGIIDALAAVNYRVKNIHPPRGLAVERLLNDYGFFFQYVDMLTWRAEPRDAGTVGAYRIYQREIGGATTSFSLLAEVDAGTFSYAHRGLLEGEDFLYKITSVSIGGEESDPDYTRR